MSSEIKMKIPLNAQDIENNKNYLSSPVLIGWPISRTGSTLWGSSSIKHMKMGLISAIGIFKYIEEEQKVPQQWKAYMLAYISSPFHACPQESCDICAIISNHVRSISPLQRMQSTDCVLHNIKCNILSTPNIAARCDLRAYTIMGFGFQELLY